MWVRGTKSICPLGVHILDPSRIPLVSPGLINLYMDLVNPHGPVVLRFKELTVLCICPDMFSLIYLNLEALTFKLLVRLDAKKGEENGVSTLC